MFNSGFRGKRATDNTGIVVSQAQFIQQKYPQPSITGYSIVGFDETALNPAGGQTVLVNGTGFASGAAVTVNGQTISPVTVISPTQLSFTSIALAGGSYSLIVYNSTGGAAILVPGLIYSAVPAWTTPAGSIGTTYETTPINTSVVATSDSAITYSLTSGSLPSGATLYANGVITGTSPVESGSTTYTFAIKAEDAELQDTTRTFTLTINTDVVTWVSPADGTTYTANINEVAGNVVLSATSAAGYNVSYSANTLPTGLTLTGNTISGTPTVVGNSATLLTATTATTNRSATRTINWVIQLGSDPFFNYTTLLLNGETSSNYWIQDASTNKFAITVNGDTRPVAFSPYETVWSNYFDGNGDYLNTGIESGLYLNGVDYTIEFWAYFTRTPGAANSGLIQCAIAQGDGAWTAGATEHNWYWIFQSNQITFGKYPTQYNLSYTTPTNVWIHYAIVGTSTNSMTLYINGVSQGTQTGKTPITGNSWSTRIGLGYFGDSKVANYFQGYLSNIRIVKGSQVYTGNFTPSTTPLTAIANTSLLTCQSNRLRDASTNNFTITKNGDVTVRNFGPFVETDTTTGSGYFDGTGDELNAGSNSAFAFGTGAYTVECWVYLPVAISTSTNGMFIVNDSTGGFVFSNDISASGGLQILSRGVGTVLATNTMLTINQWNHIVAVRSGTGTNQTSIFVNGSRVVNGTDATNWTVSGPLKLGGISTNNFYLTGYMSNVRVVKGTAVYDPSLSTLTVPTSPLTAIANTSLLTLQSRIGENNSRFVDTSGLNNIITRVGNTTQGTFSPYSQTGWSNYFDGTGDYLNLNGGTALTFGTGDFTIEFWVNPSQSANEYMMVDFRAANGAFPMIGHDSTRGVFYYLNSGYAITSNTILTPNAWYYICVARSGSSTKLFINGTQAGSTFTDSTNLSVGSNRPIIGTNGTNVGVLNLTGYISNLHVLKGTALYTSNFTPSTSPLTAIANTSLLTCQSNRFVDNSTNNFTLTRNGDVSVQSFSPFAPVINTPTSYSGYFDGTGDYLTAPAGASVSGTGIFTLEFWMYSPTIASGYRVLSAAVSGGFSITVNSTGTLGYGRALISTDGTTTGTINFNSWNHIAVVRSGTGAGQFVIYINGTSAGSFTNSTNYTSGTVYIGIDGNGTDFAFTGYISNYRIVIGTAVYTSNFTPNTIPLTAIANTSLLTLQSNRFIDNSTNNFTITSFGNSTATQFNPFGITSVTGSNAAYSVTNVGGSMYFDGNGDYLAVTNNSDAFNCGTGNFTMEFWYYDDGNNVLYPNIISSTDWATGTGGVSLRYNNTGQANKFSFFWYGVGDPWLTTPGTFAGKQWNHVALTRSSNTFTLWVNGVSQATNTNGGTINWGLTSGGPKVGGGNWDGGNSWTKGYISNLRLIKGVALYTSGFTPSSAPLTAIQNTTLLLNGANSGIIDYTGKTDLETVGNAQLSAVVKKFGSGSMYFDGSGDFVQLFTSNQTLSFRTGNFTVECWVYFNTSGQHGICQISTNPGGFNASTANSIAFQRNATGSWEIYAKNTSTGQAATINQNQWYHVALVRSGTTTTFYVDGTSLITVSADTTDYTGTYIGLGAIYSTVVPLNGYIDDFRVTAGIARYTTNFTPPTQAFITF